MCGNEFIPKKENKYVVEDRLINGGIQAAMSGQCEKPKRFDAFDCNVCGCQFIAKERLKRVDEANCLFNAVNLVLVEVDYDHRWEGKRDYKHNQLKRDDNKRE